MRYLIPVACVAATSIWTSSAMAEDHDEHSRPPKGAILTVNGPIAPRDAGTTLMHEHVFIDFLNQPARAGVEVDATLGEDTAQRIKLLGFPLPRNSSDFEFWARDPIGLDMMRDLRLGRQNRSNYLLDELEVAVDEVRHFLRSGGRTIVDVTPANLGRDPRKLREVADRLGVNIVMGTGWYRWPTHSKALSEATIDAIADGFVKEIVVGADGTDIRAGIIGEIPLDSRSPARLDQPPNRTQDELQAVRKDAVARISRGTATIHEIYDERELRVLRAAARASARTGAAITLHAPDLWIDYLDVLVEEGADLHRVVIGHAENFFLDPKLMRKAFARGVYLQADYRLQVTAGGPVFPRERYLDGIAMALRTGFERQVLLSLDICTKTGLRRYGGGGYVAIHDEIVPELLARGVTREQLTTVLTENPVRLLTLQ